MAGGPGGEGDVLPPVKSCTPPPPPPLRLPSPPDGTLPASDISGEGSAQPLPPSRSRLPPSLGVGPLFGISGLSYDLLLHEDRGVCVEVGRPGVKEKRKGNCFLQIICCCRRR